ncbi:SUMO-interacting motif-containing protein 1 isoform X2 [Serinus canaria]|uniref:SUMO-interacting motif-containing protein 1 isoform X2 n=1 Tax=Serinus canaria TaxID=9135 RepID=UPI0021CCD6A6|nr:SUMO-interacting motif-containing protein 1 isoform X2 [Serinus canaria]
MAGPPPPAPPPPRAPRPGTAPDATSAAPRARRGPTGGAEPAPAAEMDNNVVLVSDSDSEGAPSPPPQPCRSRHSLPGLAEIIDLTCEDANTDLTPSGSLAIIDLTEDMCSLLQSTLGAAQNSRNAAPAAHMSHPQLCPTAEKETQAGPEPSPAPALHNTSEKLSSSMVTAETMENCSYLSPDSRRHSWSLEQDYSTTAFNSSLDSQSDSDCQSPSPPSLDSNSSMRADDPEEDPPQPCPERNLPPRLSPAPALPITPGKAQRSLPEASNFPAHQPILQATPAMTDADSKALLDKLHNFSRNGVQHLFLQGIAPNRETQKVNRIWSSPCSPLRGSWGLWLLQFPSQLDSSVSRELSPIVLPCTQQKPGLIPRGKLSMVHTTMEENSLEGTLYFLNEFVSCQHRPPKEIICHLIKQMLLDTHEGDILNDIYSLLMKIQMLHPANITTVGWDWTLVKFIVEQQEKPPGWLLFLQYVVQTLEDDFQHNLKSYQLQKSIAKKVLSCDLCFNNVKEVVNWLVAAVTGVGFSQPRKQLQEARAEHSSSSPRLASTQTAQKEEAQTAFFAQKMMLLLQRMLAMAVEVDRSPTCSSRKIADDIFPFILNIPLRSQREALLNTMESQLLRCRLLELLFQHSCDMPTTSAMSLDKVLYFLSHSSVLPQYQDETATWQRWDEMLQYLSLLLLSYHSVKLEHLRTSVSDRMKLIAQKAKPRLQDSDDISQLDIQLKMNDFITRMQKTLGEPFPPQIQEKLFMLQELFFIVTAA